MLASNRPSQFDEDWKRDMGDTNRDGKYSADDASNVLAYFTYASGFASGHESEMMSFVEWLLDKKVITAEQAKALE